MTTRGVPGGTTARHPLVLAILALSSTVAALTQTLVLPLLPTFPALFDATVADTSWIATSTMLTGAIAGPLFGWLGDRIGLKQMLLVSLGLLVIGAVISALSTTLPMMIVGRVLQGFSTGVAGLALSMVRTTVLPERLPWAVGIVSGTMGVGTGLGVPLAGFVVMVWPWQSVFWITATCAAVAMVAIVFWVPLLPAGTTARFDLPGALGLSALLVCVLVPLGAGAQWGPTSPATLGFVAAAIVLSVFWVRRELRVSNPFVDLRLAVQPRVARSHLVAFLLGFAFFLSFTGTINIVQSEVGLGGTVLDTGLVQTPASILSIIAGPLAGFVVVKFGASQTVAVGAGIAFLAFGFRMVDLEHWLAITLSASLVSGAISFAFSALPVALMRAVPLEQTGAANGLNVMMRQIGSSTASVTGAVLLSTVVSRSGLVTEATFYWLFGLGAALAAAAWLLVVTEPAASLPLLTSPSQSHPETHPDEIEAPMNSSAPLLSVRNLSVNFETSAGDFSAIRDVSFDLHAGRTIAVVGESGSGKSTTAGCINRLLAPNGRISAGRILFEGRDLAEASEKEMTAIRGVGIGLVPQDPMSNLNPLQRIGNQILEVLEIHGKAKGKEGRQLVVDLLTMVGIAEPERRFEQYPHEFSGGMRQRVLIAMGLACRPKLLIADEPTSALDVTVQRTILDQLELLTAQMGTAVILITHDLALAAERADDVLVMFRGDVVEAGPAAEILANPQHEYTRRLLAAAPNLNSRRLVHAIADRSLDGEQPTHESGTLITLENARKEYPIRGKGFGRASSFTAVEGASFSIRAGETVAIVGESGSGKSTTAKIALKLEKPTSGKVLFEGKDVTGISGSELFDFRRKVQPVFQNPYGSLDSRFTVAASVAEPLHLHRVGDGPSRRARVAELLDQVALPTALGKRLPHELSGGQRQRVAIARALALEPKLVVLDEAVSALDVIVQAQILELLVSLQQELGLSYLFISHDLAVVRMVSHYVHVMQRGTIVESGTPDEIFSNARESYTQELLGAIPGRRLIA